MTHEELKKFAMPFGKHKGKPLEEVPLDYLDWALREYGMASQTRELLEAYRSGISVNRFTEKKD